MYLGLIKNYSKLTGDEKKKLGKAGDIKGYTITPDPEIKDKHHCSKKGGSTKPPKGGRPAK
jgi:hypothetical protein